MPKEPVSIADCFAEVAGRLLEAHGDAAAKEISDTIAREYGFPVDPLFEAAAKQVPAAMIFAVMASPQRAFMMNMVMAFTAGVAWEQGRQG